MCIWNPPTPKMASAWTSSSLRGNMTIILVVVFSYPRAIPETVCPSGSHVEIVVGHVSNSTQSCFMSCERDDDNSSMPWESTTYLPFNVSSQPSQGPDGMLCCKTQKWPPSKPS